MYVNSATQLMICTWFIDV